MRSPRAWLRHRAIVSDPYRRPVRLRSGTSNAKKLLSPCIVSPTSCATGAITSCRWYRCRFIVAWRSIHCVVPTLERLLPSAIVHTGRTSQHQPEMPSSRFSCLISSGYTVDRELSASHFRFSAAAPLTY